MIRKRSYDQSAYLKISGGNKLIHLGVSIKNLSTPKIFA
tara:strand:- start:10029 stop:10145 length:117 start_codon:yes stop_codon:yes gene_type:complete